VVAVASGAEALEAVPTFQPDVILVDMVMPGPTGRDVFEALRRAGVTVPVILISGTQRIVEEGFFRVLKNPFNLRTVGDVVAAAVNQRRGSSA
jgi:CheY-like chemotaxis protein